MSSYSGTNLTQIAEQILASKIQYQEDSFFEVLYDFGSTPALAMAMAGTTDKKSKAYKAAMRKVNFYKRGVRKPSPKSKEQILAAMQKNPKTKSRRIQQIGSLTISIQGTWRKSKDVRQRKVIHKMNAETAKKFITELLKSEEAGMDFLLFDYGVEDANFENYSITIEEF
ncbi:MAG: hypothetical protein J0M03_05250 [Acidobacteria bacterium]|nr:hypothetical protein [Acidobacteriota bacterium]